MTMKIILISLVCLIFSVGSVHALTIIGGDDCPGPGCPMPLPAPEELP